MTQFTLPTFYASNYVLPKKRNENTVLMKEFVDVEIKDVPAEDAPAVFSIKDGNRPADAYLSFGASGGVPCLVRKFDGRLYAKRWHVDEVVSGIEKAEIEEDYSRKFGNLIGGHYKDDEGSVRIGLERSSSDVVVTSRAAAEDKWGPFRKWDDELHRTVHAIKDRCDELIVVDGWVHERVGEPVIAIDFDHDKNGYTLRVVQERDVVSKYLSIYDDRARSKLPRFGLDEIDRARMVAETMFADAKFSFEDALSVEINAPWEIRFRGESELVRDIAEDVAKFGREHLSEVDGNFGLAWHDLVSAMYVRDAVTPNLIDAMQRMDSMGPAGIFKRDEDGKIEKFWQAKDEGAIWERVSFAMKMWSGRNHRGFEWVDEALRISSTYGVGNFAYEINSLVSAAKVAAALGISPDTLDELTTEAAAGRGHVIAIDDKSGPVAVVFVIAGDDGPEAVETITRHGAPSAKSVELAVAHVRSGSISTKDLAEDLSAFGI